MSLPKQNPLGPELTGFQLVLCGIARRRFPYDDARDESEGAMLREPSGKPDPTRASHSILLVEDEVFTRLAMADDLMNAGFQVIQAASADEALMLLESSAPIDLVLTDIRMPGTLDGCDLAKLIHTNWPDVKVIILSARYTEVLATTPADAFMAKPCLMPILLTAIGRLLGIADVES
jgi:two-component system, response regulator PdtaR